MRDVEERHVPRNRLALHRRLAAGAALSVAAMTIAIVGTSVPAFASQVGSVTVLALTPSVTLAKAAYSVGFTATSALTVGSGTITITINGQAGTVFPALASDYTINGTIVTVAPTVSASVILNTPVGIAAGGPVTVNAVGVTNPAPGSYTLAVQTSADVTPVATGSYNITPAFGTTQVTGLSVTPVPTTAASTAVYTATFTTATALTTAAKDTITLSSVGAAFPPVAGDYTVNGAAATGTPTGRPGNVTFAISADASGALTVVVHNVTNPTAGPHTFSVSTSKDVHVLTTSFYTITAAVAAAAGGGGTTPTAPVRLAGTDRFGTAVATSVMEFPTTGGAGGVVLSRPDDFADALVGTTLAAAQNAPLLFANGGLLTAATQAEIQRVLPAGGTVYLLGGTAAIPESVATTLTSLGFVPVRYSGADRFATALAVANALGNPGNVILATGTNFPDALAAGPAAAHLGGVVLLTNGSSLPAAVQAYLTAHPGTVYAAGGPAAAADPSATPLVGADRYATATAVATAIFTAPINVGVASGVAFPDALSGGAFQAHAAGPILLSAPTTLSPATSTYLTGAKTTVVTTNLFGGTDALSTAVQTEVTTALGL